MPTYTTSWSFCALALYNDKDATTMGRYIPQERLDNLSRYTYKGVDK